MILKYSELIEIFRKIAESVKSARHGSWGIDAAIPAKGEKLQGPLLTPTRFLSLVQPAGRATPGNTADVGASARTCPKKQLRSLSLHAIGEPLQGMLARFPEKAPQTARGELLQESISPRRSSP
jgi:hypothetical protein